MPRLLIMVPVRGRKANCERLLKAYEDTVDTADMVFILDPDDLATYEGVDWGRTRQIVLDPRGMIGPKRNYAASMFVNDYDALMCAEDDIVFATPHWDTILMETLAGMGGAGMVYPDDDRRTDVPENVLDLLRHREGAGVVLRAVDAALLDRQRPGWTSGRVRGA